MILLNHYYLYQNNSYTLILRITNIDIGDYLHDFSSEIVYPFIPKDCRVPLNFSSSSPMAASLIHIGSHQFNVSSFIEANPEFFI